MKIITQQSIKIPSLISSWTDEYFHKSAFDIPIKYPNKKVVNFLSGFNKRKQIKLYRGINAYNETTGSVTSWTYNKRIAERYIKDGGTIIEKNFIPEDILLDTTMLTAEQKKMLGYDYAIDDEEVLVIMKK